jgi:HSP20 family protein
MEDKVMRLIRREPFGDVDEFFNRMMTGSGTRWPRLFTEDNGRSMSWAPTADISETDKEYLIKAELPAVKKEDVHVTVEDGTITIKGERKHEKDDKSEKQHRIERFYGTFERSFSLPDNANCAAIQAESKDGVLTVRIPKTKAEAAKAIQVSVQ